MSRQLPSSIRSVESFGVSGLLAADAKVFHEVFHDAGGMGRAADLVAARLRDSGPDEFSLHALVLFGVLGASRVFEALSPIQFECGRDETYFALSFGFELPEGTGMDWDGLSGRVMSGVATSPLDELLLSFCRNADQVILKGQPSVHRVEICALVRWGRRQAREPAPLEVVILAGEPAEAPEAAEYTALGDLDYSQLLKRSSDPDSPAESPVTGEVLVHQAKTAEEMVRRIRGRKLKLEESVTVQADGAPLTDSGESSVVVSGSDSEQASAPAVVTATLPPKRPKRRLLSKLLKWVSPESESDTAATEEKDQSVGGGETPAQEPKAHESSSEVSEISTAARELEKNLGDGALGRAIREVAGIKSEAKNPRVERWLEGMMAELSAERSRLVESSRQLTNSFRAKELEFKNRENSLQQSIRERDEALRVKTMGAMRMKEQVAKLQISLERAKLGSGAGDENGMKYKYNQSQKLLQTARSESELMKVRIEELQSKLAQAVDQRKQTVPLAQHSELERQVEKQARQIEELRRQKPSPPPEEVRKNLEIAQRVAIHQKEKSEQLELVVQEQKIEVERLKQELERLKAAPEKGKGPGSSAA